MRLFREFLRKLKYQIKFIGTKKELDFSFISTAKTNQDLKKLMDFYGSDKGGKNNHHNFAQYYSFLFHNQKNHIQNFLEIGLGTNNLDVPSNMGTDGVPLASLRAWRDYFKNANIFGGDIDKKILKDEERIKTFYVDQTDPNSIKQMFEKINVDKFDVILEDGLHEYNANICFFENAIQYLSENGTYIIEDVYYKDQIKFIKYFDQKPYNFSIIDIYHEKNISNNCILIIKKNV